MTESKRIAKRVLLIGWDAADWKLIDKYMAEGSMPYMKQFLERGSRGNLATLQPVLSPMLWNSIGTGKRSYKHGIHGFTEPMPDGKGIRPSSSTTRKCKALWNICTQEGMTSNVVSWFVGHPAEPINGVCVSEMFRSVPIDKKDPQSTELPELPPQSVHPESMREALADLRLHPGELTEEEILTFIPNAAKIDQSKDRRLQTFAKLFSEMINTHNAATHLMENTDWDFMGVYLDAIDHFGHGFMEYHPPRMEHVSEEDFEIYQDIIAGVYKFHDLMLGRMMALAGEDTTIVLCSDHGYHSDHLRPKETPKEPAGPAVWHRDQGVIAMAGPGVKQGETIVAANLLDIAPTVLNLLGLPAAKDMDGKTLTQAIGTPGWSPPEPIESWEDVPGESGMHPRDKQEDPFAAREALKQLIELGYIEEPDPDAEKAAKNASREAKFNVARSYMEGGLLDEASKRLEELFEAEPDQPRFGVALLRVYMRQSRFDEVRPLAEKLLGEMEKVNESKADRIDNAIKAIEEKPEKIIANAEEQMEEAYLKRVEAEKAAAEDEGREPVEIERPAVKIDEESLGNRKQKLQTAVEKIRGFDIRSIPTVNMLLGRLEAIDGNLEKSLEHLNKAEKAEPRLPGLHLQLGQTYLRMRRNESAIRAFQKALDIDSDNASAHEGLAAALQRLKRNDEALDHALTAVELVHDMPRAHLRLGITLVRLKHYEQAVQAFETCLKLAPMTGAAHRYLAMIFRNHLDQPELAEKHRAELRRVQKKRKEEKTIAQQKSFAENPPHQLAPGPTGIYPASNPEEIITIVSGLPRTGTSVMMQMLAAGGIEPLSDGNREADESNPKGYYEYDKAIQLASDSSWVGDAKGKVVKIVAQLLPNLPDFIDGKIARYRIVFMDRDLDEVVASQHTMLSKQGRKGADLDADKLKETYASQLDSVQRMLAERRIPWVQIKHADVISNPEQVAEELNQGFGGHLDVQAMVQVVDSTLYRERT
jgi:predicted AlkP superfamily phosphohydrolase/phosphomutase/tetratricopeptide (TPR) repeat protein